MMESEKLSVVENSAAQNNLEYFNSPSKGKRDFLNVIADIVGFIAEEPLARYSVVVGTDSEFVGLVNTSTKLSAGGASTNGNGYSHKKEGMGTANFVSVITIHRVGRHGRYFWKRMPAVKTFDRHDRMLKEAYFSLDVAHRLTAELRDKLKGHFYDFEIHLDIGQNGPTKDMIQEIVGMITGNGFKARIKPESYAANKVADRYV
ncbi:MAG: ribonuclease H-like YkuK family protein [bacterium]|nr:ribonuclease H-like YkuK family protein [bacterium]